MPVSYTHLIETDMVAKLGDQVNDLVKKKGTLGRLGTPEEIADTVAITLIFLLSIIIFTRFFPMSCKSPFTVPIITVPISFLARPTL